MKRLTLSFLFSVMLLPLFGQLNLEHNRIRQGDQLIKQQVEYKEPGESGRNKVWDFSKLKTINETYELTYDFPPSDDSLHYMGYNLFDKKMVHAEDLIVGTEHNTMYYYQYKGDSLLLLGHENPSVKLQYIQPYHMSIYPLGYGQSIKSNYSTKGLYSATVDIQSEGTVETTADAYGKMILPTGDTLNPVLRVKTVQTIIDPVHKDTESEKILETYRWYTKGYRYPIFETVRNIDAKDKTVLFSTAFFFPPQDHLYLDTDPENQKILDEMWDMENKEKQNTTADNDKNLEQNSPLEDYITYSIYPNPVSSTLNIEYEMKEDAPVLFQLFSFNGGLAKQITEKEQRVGTYKANIDCTGLMPGNYVLRVTVNGVFVNEKIIKK